jgi:hypothetical protein
MIARRVTSTMVVPTLGHGQQAIQASHVDQTETSFQTRNARKHPRVYRHTQQAPLCLLVYGTAVMFLVLGWVLRNEPVVQWVFLPTGLLMLILAASFHHLTVEDEGDRLTISFGPIPLFRRSIKYENIVSVEVGRTTILDGWGIHMSFRGGWAWNIWGRDCVVLRLRKGILRVGTDDADQLSEFVDRRISEQTPLHEEDKT